MSNMNKSYSIMHNKKDTFGSETTSEWMIAMISLVG